MARLDYIQPDPIRAGRSSRSVNGKPFGDISDGNQRNDYTDNPQQLGNARNAVNNLANTAKGTAQEIYNQGAIPLLGRGLSAAKETVYDPVIQSFGNLSQNAASGANNVGTVGQKLLFGANNYEQSAPQINADAVNLNGNRLPSSAPQVEASGADQNTPVLGQGTTNNYRDAQIYQDNAPNIEGDTLGVSFGGGKGSVSGLNPDQAQRIQSSLSQGRQVSSFGLGQQPQEVDASGNPTLFGRPTKQAELDRLSGGLNDATRGRIMEAARSGAISADKASALLNQDYRASDRMDRLGGNAESYIRPDAQPNDIKSAMAYGQNLNNFTRNGELNNEQALLAQRNYLASLGGYKGVANASGKEKEDKGKFKSVTEDAYDSLGTKTGQKTRLYNDVTGQYAPEQKTDEKYTTENASIVAKVLANPDDYTPLQIKRSEKFMDVYKGMEEK